MEQGHHTTIAQFIRLCHIQVAICNRPFRSPFPQSCARLHVHSFTIVFVGFDFQEASNAVSGSNLTTQYSPWKCRYMKIPIKLRCAFQALFPPRGQNSWLSWNSWNYLKRDIHPPLPQNQVPLIYPTLRHHGTIPISDKHAYTHFIFPKSPDFWAIAELSQKERSFAPDPAPSRPSLGPKQLQRLQGPSRRWLARPASALASASAPVASNASWKGDARLSDLTERGRCLGPDSWYRVVCTV